MRLLSQRAATGLFKFPFFCCFFSKKSACGQLIHGLQAIENINIKKNAGKQTNISLFY